MHLFLDLIKHLNLSNPEFDKIGRVHDWRNYVPDEWQKCWKEFTDRERMIIAAMAEKQAGNEEWD